MSLHHQLLVSNKPFISYQHQAIIKRMIRTKYIFFEVKQRHSTRRFESESAQSKQTENSLKSNYVSLHVPSPSTLISLRQVARSTRARLQFASKLFSQTSAEWRYQLIYFGVLSRTQLYIFELVVPKRKGTGENEPNP